MTVLELSDFKIHTAEFISALTIISLWKKKFSTNNACLKYNKKISPFKKQPFNKYLNDNNNHTNTKITWCPEISLLMPAG